jgi:hypothetical protein
MSSNKPRITVSLPCFGRPLRTKRAIMQICDQDITGWEAFIMGDCCPDFQFLIDSGWLEEQKQQQQEKGNVIHYFNAEERGGYCGYKLTNNAIRMATGEYIVFLANDDMISPDHFRHYLSEIENTAYNMVYYNSELVPLQGVRETLCQIGCIGHCDIIVKTEVAKKAKPHSLKYTHDWDFIEEIAGFGRVKKAKSKMATYKVMNLPSIGCSDKIN